MPAIHSWLRKQSALQQVMLQPKRCLQYTVQQSTAQRLIRYGSAAICDRVSKDKDTKVYRPAVTAWLAAACLRPACFCSVF